MGYEIKLDVFQGPLDLLLYLIKKHEIDIYDIPIALITQQYLEHIEKLRSLNLDLAGEYLILAATLIHIKSKMLLPQPEELDSSDEAEDPRRELVEQLVSYQTFKEALLELNKLPQLERDVFKRGWILEAEGQKEKEDENIEASLFDLIEAFQRIISGWDKTEIMEIDREKMTLAEKMNDIMEQLQKADGLTLEALLVSGATRRRIIYTFLALLELVKLKMVKAYQNTCFSTIRIYLAVAS